MRTQDHQSKIKKVSFAVAEPATEEIADGHILSILKDSEAIEDAVHLLHLSCSFNSY